MSMLAGFIALAIGAAAGALARHWVYAICEKRLAVAAHFPIATLSVNLIGSFLIDIVLSIISANDLDPLWVKALAPGFCSAFTTFSSFIADCRHLFQAHRYRAALITIALTIIAAPALTLLGLTLTKEGSQGFFF